MARSRHPIKSESETKYAPLRKPTTNAHLWYFIYDSLIIVLGALSVTFWVLGAQSPLLYPFDFGQWLLANPKISTIIWTACGSVLAAVFMFLLKGVLILMSKQRARSGATLSTIEGMFSLEIMSNSSLTEIRMEQVCKRTAPSRFSTRSAVWIYGD